MGIPNRIEILGVQIDNVTQEEALQRIVEMVRSGRPHQIVTPAIEQVVTARRDSEFGRVVQNCDLVLADGMPVVFAARWHKTPLKERVTGSDLTPQICRVASEKQFRVFFFGAEEGIAAEAARILAQRYPGLPIAGIYSPPYRFEENPLEEEKALQTVREARPDILLVAMSSPRQEKWIDRRKQELGVPVMIGIGGSFNFITGREKRAPQWLQNLGLEALYRSWQRPKEVWRRIIRNAPYFFLLLFDLFTYRTQKRIAAWTRPLLLGLGDALLAPGAFLLASWIYFRSGLVSGSADPFADYPSLLSMPAYSELPVFVAILAVIALWHQRLYERDKYVSFGEIAKRVFWASLAAVLLLIAFQFVFKNIYVNRLKGFSRMVFGLFGVFLSLFLLAWRWLFMRLEYFLHRRGVNLDRIIIVGMNDAALALIQVMLHRPELGNRPLGFVWHEPAGLPHAAEIPYLGTLNDLRTLLPARKVDEVLIADSTLPRESLLEVVRLCRQYKVALSIIPTIQEWLGAASEIKRVGDYRVITVTFKPEVEDLLSDRGEKTS